MKKNRYIPFGYTMRNGKLVIEPSEADVIRNIYEDYVNGATLREIAERLTSAGVPYSEKMTDWGKARVARIIENTKYLGDSEYDKIVDDSLFSEAVAAKKARQISLPGDLGPEIAAVKNRVRCLACGYPMSRRSSKRYKTATVLTCTNPECGKKVGISAAYVLSSVMRIMARIKKNDALLDKKAPADGYKEEMTERIRNFNDEVASGSASEERLMRLIGEIACEEYEKIDSSSEHASEELKRKIRRIVIRDTFSPELFDALVQSVRLGEGETEIITKNNIKIGGKDGSQEDTEKDGHRDTAEE